MSEQISNPNGANQYKADPRQTAFLAAYLDPKSETYSNGLQSALKAGYEQEYAENILHQMPKWLSESLDSMLDMKRLRRAERNLDEIQELEIKDENGKVIMDLIDKRTRVDMFIAKSLDKNKYSDRQEVTGANGEKFEISIVNYGENNTTT